MRSPPSLNGWHMLWPECDEVFLDESYCHGFRASPALLRIQRQASTRICIYSTYVLTVSVRHLALDKARLMGCHIIRPPFWRECCNAMAVRSRVRPIQHSITCSTNADQHVIVGVILAQRAPALEYLIDDRGVYWSGLRTLLT
jgi:hypothetical protein